MIATIPVGIKGQIKNSDRTEHYVLVITRDDQYFHLADRCLKLEEGRLTEIEIRQVSMKPRSSRGRRP